MNEDFSRIGKIKNYDVGHTRCLRNRRNLKALEAKKVENSKDIFENPFASLSNVQKNYQKLKFIDNPSEKPAIVMPDGHIFIEKFSPYYNKASLFIKTIAHQCSHPEYMEEYQITPYSISRALSDGLNVDGIINGLSMISKVIITEELIEKIRRCCRYTNNISMVRSGQRYFIETNELSVIQELASKPIFSDNMVPPEEGSNLYGETNFICIDKEVDKEVNELKFDFEEEEEEKEFVLRFEVKSESIPSIKAFAQENNIFISYEYDIKGDETEDKLNFGFKDMRAFRTYQDETIAKIISNNRAKNGYVVLPYGTQKITIEAATIIGINRSAIICFNSIEPIRKMRAFLTKYTTIDQKKIAVFTGVSKKPLNDEPCILLTTYGMISANQNRTEEALNVVEQIKNRDWGVLIMDEVQETSSRSVKAVTEIVTSRVKLGILSTISCETDKVETIVSYIGPKIYEESRVDLAINDQISRVKCYEVISHMTPNFFREYLIHQRNEVKKRILITSNPNKINTLDALIQFHERKGDKIIVFCDYIDILLPLAEIFNREVVCSSTDHQEASRIYKSFERGIDVNTIFISRGVIKASNLPKANVFIQLSSHYGSLMNELQRIGSMLKKREGRGGKINSYFYTLVTEDTIDSTYSVKRQRLFVEQGYDYETVTNALERWPPTKDTVFKSSLKQNEWLSKMIRIDDLNTDDVPTEEIKDAASLPLFINSLPFQSNQFFGSLH